MRKVDLKHKIARSGYTSPLDQEAVYDLIVYALEQNDLALDDVTHVTGMLKNATPTLHVKCENGAKFTFVAPLTQIQNGRT